MQLMTLNSLLMFDIVFLFFLFLVGVSCLVYYLPASRTNPIAPYEIINSRVPPRPDSPVDDVWGLLFQKLSLTSKKKNKIILTNKLKFNILHYFFYFTMKFFIE